MTLTEPDGTYLVRRFCFCEDDPANREVIASGLTLEEAQAHCRSPENRGTNEFGPWFDGYHDQEEEA